MKNSSASHRHWLRPFPSTCVRITIATGLLWWISSTSTMADDAATNAPPPKATAKATATTKAATKESKPKLTGVELYAIHCNRCHPERYPVEFNPSQWKTLMLHMRVRANIPANQAREILKYLQEEAGN